MSKMSLAVQKVARETEDPSHTAVERLAQADRALAEAITATDAVRLVASAKALDEWARAVRAGEEHQRQSALFVVRAKRNAGERIAADPNMARRGDAVSPGGFRNVVKDDVTTLADIGVSRDESSDWKRLAQEFPTDAELVEAAESLERPSVAGAHRLAALMSSDSVEWYTPKHIVEAVQKAMGGIDLDPCADPSKSIPAKNHYTEQDNGLEYGWRGRVYMNPPYGRVIGTWVDKLADEFEAGNVSEAIALVPARTDTSWFAHLPWSMTCFVTGRLAFSGHENSAPFPSAACYMGPNGNRFAEVFLELGIVTVRLEVGG